MTLSKTQFFLLLFAALVGPFLAYKIIWLAKTKQTNGIVYFIGHTMELNGAISSHLVILFKVDSDTITFNAPASVNFKTGEIVPIRYQKDNPSNARVNSPIRIWGDTLVYSLWPLVVLLVIFLTPQRFDPLIPKNARILLGKKCFIKIIESN